MEGGLSQKELVQRQGMSVCLSCFLAKLEISRIQNKNLVIVTFFLFHFRERKMGNVSMDQSFKNIYFCY